MLSFYNNQLCGEDLSSKISRCFHLIIFFIKASKTPRDNQVIITEKSEFIDIPTETHCASVSEVSVCFHVCMMGKTELLFKPQAC